MIINQLEQLKTTYKTCTRCEKLCNSRTQVVFGSGNPNAQILFIGEAPGATEDKEGIPFCGASGKILQDLLTTINLTRSDIFITNTVLCRPEKNRNPEKQEIENCRERLDQTISIIRPKVIVTIGNFATERILKKKGITQLRGKIHLIKILNKECQVVPIIHPANFLYNGRNTFLWQQMVEDFKIINSVINSSK